MKLQNIPRNASKNYAIRKAFSDSNFDPVPILDTHDMSKRLGTTEGFEIDGKKYALAP